MKSLSPQQRSEDRYLYQFDLKNDFLQYFSLGDHPCTISFRSIFFIIQPLLANLGFLLVDHEGHYSSTCPIIRPPKSFVSCSNQDSTVQGSSPHKCGQRVQWGVLNVVATTIPPVTLGLNPSLKLFLYSVASSGIVPLTWPRLTSPALPFESMVPS